MAGHWGKRQLGTGGKRQLGTGGKRRLDTGRKRRLDTGRITPILNTGRRGLGARHPAPILRT